MISTMPIPSNPYEVVAVLPCGAILAARACVPGHIGGTLRAGLAAIAALVPLTAAAARPAAAVPTAPLSAWLQAHGLTDGLAGYWNSSAITLESGNRVRVCAVLLDGRRVIPYLWETNTLWFDASRYYANFVIIDLAHHGLSPLAERAFGKPARIGRLAQWEIVIYHKNLLKQLAMPGTGP